MSTHRDMANALRFLAVDAVEEANSGHPGMPMGMADVATVLFSRFLKFDPADPKWPDRDRFVLSAGHGSMLLYAVLHLLGVDGITRASLKDFRQLHSLTPGHPEYGHTPGVETTTGPLAQGLATATGMALAERMLAARFGGDLVDHYTYVLAGDGCLMEGLSQEAIAFAGHQKLSRLICLWDDNRITIDGTTALSSSMDEHARFRAAGWDTQAVDGHDPEAVAEAIAAARQTDTPSLIACRTTIGYGAPTLAGTSKTHGAPLGAEEIAGARKALDWPHPPFRVPAGTEKAWHAVGEAGGEARAAWQKRLAAKPEEERKTFERMMAGALPEGWRDGLAAYKKALTEERPREATRNVSQTVLGTLLPAVDMLVGGSADLSGSNKTRVAEMTDVAPPDYAGRYINYGIREHAMAAVMNGLSLHGGFIPYGGTFLVFSDYLRPALRLSAMMGRGVIYVLTHDSIGVGEDGPTHQPVEHLAALRAMPGVSLYRPCDAQETAECWEAAIENRGGPSVLVLSRQKLPALQPYSHRNRCVRGGYVLAPADGERKVTLLASGSEVQLAVAAREILQERGVPAAVVSMPCFERFDAQPAEWQREVLGPGTVRVAVEAATPFGWHRYVGEKGEVLGMSGYGASAPAETLFEHFGLTAEAVVKAAERHL